MEPTTEDPNFWTSIMTLRDPAYREPTEDEHLNLADQITDAAGDLARQISTRESAYRIKNQSVPDGVVVSPDWQLAYLRSLREASLLIEQLAANAARTAGAIGVGYPHLGTSWGITRQAARLRWPGVVRPTRNDAETAEVNVAGGTAHVSYVADEKGYWWIGTGADGTTAEAQQTYTTQPEAAAHAGAFLAQHGK